MQQFCSCSRQVKQQESSTDEKYQRLGYLLSYWNIKRYQSTSISNSRIPDESCSDRLVFILSFFQKIIKIKSSPILVTERWARS